MTGPLHGPVEDHGGFAEIKGDHMNHMEVLVIFTSLILFVFAGWDLLGRCRDI